MFSVLEVCHYCRDPVVLSRVMVGQCSPRDFGKHTLLVIIKIWGNLRRSLSSWNFLGCRQMVGNPQSSQFCSHPQLWRNWATGQSQRFKLDYVASSLQQYLHFWIIPRTITADFARSWKNLKKTSRHFISSMLQLVLHGLGGLMWRFGLDLILIWFRNPAVMMVGRRYIREKEEGGTFG